MALKCDMESFGSRLEKLMANRELSQVAVAKHFGITQPAVANWIKSNQIDKRKLKSLAALLNTSVDCLLEGAPPTYERASQLTAPGVEEPRAIYKLPPKLPDESRARLIIAWEDMAPEDREKTLSDAEARATMNRIKRLERA